VLQNTQVLDTNDAWSIPENLPAGSQVNFSVQSPAGVSFLVSNETLSSLPKTNVTDTIQTQGVGVPFTLNNLVKVFLTAGSSVNCTFNSSDTVDFSIMNESIYSIFSSTFSFSGAYIANLNITNLTANGANFVAPSDQFYDLVWFNDRHTTEVTINFTVQTTLIADDYSSVLYSASNSTSISGGVIVPTSGNWYLTIFFDPRYPSPTYATTTAAYDINFQVAGLATLNAPYEIEFILAVGIGAVIIIALVMIDKRQQQRSSRDTG
jgi:hypothetical protein